MATSPSLSSGNPRDPKRPFLSDVSEIRRRAREHMDRGPLTPNYQGDLKTVLRILNEALATEIVCVLRYQYHYYMAEGIHSEAVKEEFQEHAREEQEHAGWLAERIKQLGGTPEMNPDGLLSRSHSQYATGTTLVEMIEEDLLAERIAIESYREMVQFVGETDPTTRRLFEKILEKEEEHADDMAGLLLTLDPSKKPVHAA